MDHSLLTLSSAVASEIYLNVETMPLAFFFSFFNLYSLLTRIFHQHQGLSCNLNVDDTPTHISNQYVSHILLLHFQLLAGYLLESQPSISSAESFSSDSNWVLSPSLFQLFSQDPSFDDCT